jgi:hypothetical protein
MPTTLLSVLITVRLLLPPGICICQWSSPAARLLIAVCGQDSPVQDLPDDDDHNPGCPASYLAVGMGVAPPAGPGLIELPLSGFTSNQDTAAFSSPSEPILRDHAVDLPSAPLYVEQCALIV